jgi:predicted pyridoxine 5'-phosphate oxidase superfamily flavin-nucleotide-binding protein
MGRFSQLAFTPAVKARQTERGSREAYERVAGPDEVRDQLGENEEAFLAERDSFYMASVGSTGWPYIQHRGGPKGFVRILDERTLGFADYRGNRQYITLGNLSGDDRVALIFVDYPNRARLKVLARAEIITENDDPQTMARLAVDGQKGVAERGFVLHLEGFDWNCPRHITPRYTEEEIRERLTPLMSELEALRAENARLRAAATT